MKCLNFLCGSMSQGKKGYCLKCIHSTANVMSRCEMCDNTYIVTIGIKKKYCSSTCRGRAYYIRKRLDVVKHRSTIHV
jgi:hypothetical protein